MKLTAIKADLTHSEPIVILNSDDCLEMGVSEKDHVRVTGKTSLTTGVVVAKTALPKGFALIPNIIMDRCGIENASIIEVAYSPSPESIISIRKKINGEKLTREEIDSIIEDIMDGDLYDKEIIAFVSSFNIGNADSDEIAELARSMASTGKSVDFGVRPIFDFHSLGGVPGNKITPIIVSIIASEGLTIPKLSSRAVSSACGTSDYVDTFCDVELDSDTILRAVRDVKGVFACGNEDYAPVGDKIIRAERPMGIDPRPMMIASIMSKKIALGVTDLLMDIPVGRGTKIQDIETAYDFAEALIEVGDRLGIVTECAVSYADQPLGMTIGPILEARECIRILEDPKDDCEVLDKACRMAGIILEMNGFDDGTERAFSIVKSGKAHEKFLEIVKVQNGDPGLRSEDLVPGPFVKDVHAKNTGIVQYVDIPSIVAVAKGAGAPGDIGAGIELVHRAGDNVYRGDVLFRIYAESQGKLDRAIESARSRPPMFVSNGAISPRPDSMIVLRISPDDVLNRCLLG